jgi:hypothetical protein
LSIRGFNSWLRIKAAQAGKDRNFHPTGQLRSSGSTASSQEGTESEGVADKAFANHSFQSFSGPSLLSIDPVCSCSKSIPANGRPTRSARLPCLCSQPAQIVQIRCISNRGWTRMVCLVGLNCSVGCLSRRCNAHDSTSGTARAAGMLVPCIEKGRVRYSLAGR